MSVCLYIHFEIWLKLELPKLKVICYISATFYLITDVTFSLVTL